MAYSILMPVFRLSGLDGWSPDAKLVAGTRVSSALQIQIAPDGQVDVTGLDRSEGQSRGLLDIVGRHRLRFP